MPAKVSPLDRARVRLSGPIVDKVSHLARLAGVTSSDIVNYVLSEVLTDDGPEAPPADAPPATPMPHRVRRRREPAAVIPITRGQQAPAPVRMTLEELRRRADGVCEHARAARAMAAEACLAAARARDRATASLQTVNP
jgi:hypothetical protein